MDDPWLTPGARVRNPSRPDWGEGQVQSAIGHRVTVNFEHCGKLTLDMRHVRLELVAPPRED
ncbi:MAG: DUF3553 domain-containing protein [Geminicoccaceae bacterium]